MWLTGILILAAAVAPTTATVPADQSTPRGALKVFSSALESGKRQNILDSLAADSEQDRKIAAMTADLAEASAALRSAGIKAFGPDKARALGAHASESADAAARIDHAIETIQGDTATVRPIDNEGPPMTLIKRDGKWLVPVSELRKDVESNDVERNLVDVAAQIKVMRQIAAEVAAGKFTSAVNARQALDEQIVKGALPTTAPVPAKPPSTSP